MTYFTNRVLILSIFLILNTGARFNIQAQDFQITDPTLTFPTEYTIDTVMVQGRENTRTHLIVNARSLFSARKILLQGENIPDAIKRLYRVGLFSDVKIIVKEMSLTGISLLIKVKEQPRLLEYKLEGIKRSERRDLKDEISLVPGVAITEASIEQSKSIIRRFFRKKGFWFTDVKTRIDTSKIEDRFILVFEISKGKRLEVKNIIFDGIKLKNFCKNQ